MEAEPIPGITARVINALRDVPEKEWPAVYDTLNHWEWDSRLGDKPAGWDNMPRYTLKKFLWSTICRENKRARTRSRIIEPILQYIDGLIGHKAILRYHHLHNLHRTEQQFEDWWDSEYFSSATKY